MRDGGDTWEIEGELVITEHGTLTAESGATIEGIDGAATFASEAEAKTGTEAAKNISPKTLQDVLKDDKATISTAALGTVRLIHGQLTASHAHISGGNLVGVRGLVTLSGEIDAGGAYLYGAQGKLAITGKMNHEDSRLCGMLAQLDTNGATLTKGQLSVLWVDHGAGISGDGGGQFNMIRITNTVVGSKPNAIIYAHSNATNLLDLSAPAGTMDWLAAAGTDEGAAGASSGCAAQKVLVISVGGDPYYIPIFDNNASEQ